MWCFKWTHFLMQYQCDFIMVLSSEICLSNDELTSCDPNLTVSLYIMKISFIVTKEKKNNFNKYSFITIGSVIGFQTTSVVFYDYLYNIF